MRDCIHYTFAASRVLDRKLTRSFPANQSQETILDNISTIQIFCIPFKYVHYEYTYQNMVTRIIGRSSLSHSPAIGRSQKPIQRLNNSTMSHIELTRCAPKNPLALSGFHSPITRVSAPYSQDLYLTVQKTNHWSARTWRLSDAGRPQWHFCFYRAFLLHYVPMVTWERTTR